MLNNIISQLSLIAEAGGGGSSSDSGGGGVIALFLGLGVLPTRAIGKHYRKQFKQTNDQVAFDHDKRIAWAAAIALAVVWAIIGSIMGGVFLICGIAAAFGSLCGVGVGLKGVFKRSKEAEARLNQAAVADPAWNETALTNGAINVYQAFQRDWSSFDLNAISGYLTPRYYAHNYLILKALRSMGRQNQVAIKEISDCVIIDAQDATDNSQDVFIAGITANLNDQLIETRDGSSQKLYGGDNESSALWRFQRDGNSWRLDGIQPLTAAGWVYRQDMEQFAAANGAYYSLDWGRLLLPARGQLFRNGSFTSSDINNHIIGQMRRTDHFEPDDVIYQIYNYSEAPADQSGNTWTVGQMILPKYYDDIVIRHKKGLVQFKIKGLREVSTEWSNFNNKFQVFASSTEQATSLELLNPQMMQWLESAPFEINIEVVDNVVYFYSPYYSADSSFYGEMLKLLQAAWREMYM